MYHLVQVLRFYMVEMTQVEFAAVIGLTARAVANLRERGLPHRTEGRTILIPIPEAVRWYVTFKAAALVPPAPTSLEESRERHEAARAEMAELELAERRGELVAVKDHERMLSDAMARMRSKLRNLPYKAATQVTGKTVDARKAQVRRLVDEVSQELYAAGDVPEEAA